MPSKALQLMDSPFDAFWIITACVMLMAILMIAKPDLFDIEDEKKKA